MTPGDDLWRLCPEGRKQVLIEHAQKADMHRPIKLIGLGECPRRLTTPRRVPDSAGMSQHRLRADRPRPRSARSKNRSRDYRHSHCIEEARGFCRVRAADCWIRRDQENPQSDPARRGQLQLHRNRAMVNVTIQVRRPHDAMDRPRVCVWVNMHSTSRRHHNTVPQHAQSWRFDLVSPWRLDDASGSWQDIHSTPVPERGGCGWLDRTHLAHVRHRC